MGTREIAFDYIIAQELPASQPVLRWPAWIRVPALFPDHARDFGPILKVKTGFMK